MNNSNLTAALPSLFVFAVSMLARSRKKRQNHCPRSLPKANWLSAN
ncbi:MAG: hypothetical protein U0Y68_01255 [Blastocatellia bacterium]